MQQHSVREARELALISNTTLCIILHLIEYMLYDCSKGEELHSRNKVSEATVVKAGAG